jgi:hypothetical protein
MTFTGRTVVLLPILLCPLSQLSPGLAKRKPDAEDYELLKGTRKSQPQTSARRQTPHPGAQGQARPTGTGESPETREGFEVTSPPMRFPEKLTLPSFHGCGQLSCPPHSPPSPIATSVLPAPAGTKVP